MSPRSTIIPALRALSYRLAATGSLLGLGMLCTSPARANNRFLEIPQDVEAEGSPAYAYANLSNRAAYAELDRRRIAYLPETAIRGVRAPMRLKGPLNGVTIRSTLPEAEWDTTPYNILDARLALALDDFTRLLAMHDIVELVHFTMYRVPKVRGNEPQFRHPGGLAIDVGALKKANGEWLSVGPHWPGEIGAQTCGSGARRLLTRRGRELMSIACEVADRRLFHYMLSPHFDHAHDDHWHLEVKPGVRWFLVN